jgi:predicted ester cyclase
VSLAANKELVRRFYAEVINGRDLAAIDVLLTTDFVHNGEQRGREGQKAGVGPFLGAFPDLRHEILMMLAEGDLVCAHQRWSGTHEGEFLGVAATGKAVEFTTTAILRIEGEMIAQAWDEGDYLGLMTQLGAS